MSTTPLNPTHLYAYSGDDFPINLTFQDTLGNAIDITDYTLYITIKDDQNNTDDEALYKADVVVSSLIPALADPTHGKATLVIGHHSTEGLRGNLEIDAKYKDGNGNVGTIFNGEIAFTADLTERASV
jgi:hypothetical protein